MQSRGYAVNRVENLKGLHAIGVAAMEQSGNLIGGFNITGPKYFFTGPD